MENPIGQLEIFLSKSGNSIRNFFSWETLNRGVGISFIKKKSPINKVSFSSFKFKRKICFCFFSL